MKNLLNLNHLLIASLFFALFSCSDETTNLVSPEEFAEASAEQIETRSSSGAKGCFELVFPITINFEDGSSAEVESIDDLKETVKGWKEENPDATMRPTLEFPVEVMTQDGEIVSVDSREDLLALRKECRENFIANGGAQGPCFKVVYPVSVAFPDGEELSFDDRRSLKKAIREWRKENQGSEERPVLVFPITVVDKDGNEITVNSKEELKALKEDCRG